VIRNEIKNDYFKKVCYSKKRKSDKKKKSGSGIRTQKDKR